MLGSCQQGACLPLPRPRRMCSPCASRPTLTATSPRAGQVTYGSGRWPPPSLVGAPLRALGPGHALLPTASKWSNCAGAGFPLLTAGSLWALPLPAIPLCCAHGPTLSTYNHAGQRALRKHPTPGPTNPQGRPLPSPCAGLKLQGQIGKFGNVELSDIAAFVEMPDGKVGAASCTHTLSSSQQALLPLHHPQHLPP